MTQNIQDFYKKLKTFQYFFLESKVFFKKYFTSQTFAVECIIFLDLVFSIFNSFLQIVLLIEALHEILIWGQNLLSNSNIKLFSVCVQL